MALSLLSNTAFGQGATIISHWEESRLGLQWDNVAKPLSIEEPLNMGAIFGMMICDIVLYLLLAWYVCSCMCMYDQPLLPFSDSGEPVAGHINIRMYCICRTSLASSTYISDWAALLDECACSSGPHIGEQSLLGNVLLGLIGTCSPT